MITFPGHDKAEGPKDASDPMGTVMSFLNAGIAFGAANSILGAVQGVAVQVAGYTPGGYGFEPAVAEMTPAPTPTAPTMQRNVNGLGM